MRRIFLMRRYFQLGGLLVCIALGSGCSPPPDSANEQPTGAELEAQMKAMEAVGTEAEATGTEAEATGKDKPSQ
jgi:hypothetical protein